MTSTNTSEMAYIYAAPAAELASETRAITLSPSVLLALNSFLDEILLTTLHLIAPSSAAPSLSGGPSLNNQTLRLPLQTVHIKDGLLACFARARGNNQALAREALLEAELEVREWIRTKGHRSDPALSLPNLSRKASHASTLESIVDDPATVRIASMKDISAELRTATCALSSLGARAGFHNSAGARANVAANLAGRGQLLLTTPALVLYTSCILNYLASHLVKGCAGVVERNPSSSEARIKDLLELMDEDSRLCDVWKASDISKMLSMETSTGRRAVHNESSASEKQKSVATALTALRDTGASASVTLTLLGPDRRGSLRNKKSLASNLALQQNNRGISSADLVSLSDSRPSTGSQAGAGSQALVSSIPIRTSSHSPTASLSPAQQYQQAVGGHPRGRGSSGGTESSGQTLPEDAKVYLRFADAVDTKNGELNGSNEAQSGAGGARSLRSGSQSQPHPQRLPSTRSRNGGRPSNATETTVEDDEFESLIAGKDTLKMSLTPSRFKFGGTGAPTSDTNATMASRNNAGSPSLPRAATQVNKPVQRFQARSAKPSGLVDDSAGDSETLDEDDDEELFGMPKRRQAKKESLLDLLSSEPPWAQSSSDGTASGAKASKAERMMGMTNGTVSDKGSSRPRGRTSPTDSPIKFAPIANIESLTNYSIPDRSNTAKTTRPDTGVSSITGADSIFGSSNIEFFRSKAQEFPEPPGQSPGRLQSHKSSPNLSRAASAADNGAPYGALSPMSSRRKLVAKDERTIRADRNDDLLDFFKNTPPPPPTSIPFDALDSSSSLGGRSSKGSKLKNFLTPSLSKRPSNPPSLSNDFAQQPGPLPSQSSSMFRMPSLPRSRQSSRDMDLTAMTDDFGRLPPRKLSKVNGLRRAGSQRERSSTAETLQEKEVEASQHAENPATSVQGASRYVFPDASVQQESATTASISAPLLTPENSRDSLFKIATGNSTITGQLSPPLSTARSANPPVSHYETPLQTPPATPQEKRVPAFPAAFTVGDTLPEMRRTASEGAVLDKQHRRASSIVKRKPSHRIEDEEELSALYGNGSRATSPVNPLLLSAIAGERKGSVASTASSGSGGIAGGLTRQLSVQSGGSSYHATKEQSRSREPSSQSFMSVSSGSFEVAEAPETASVHTAKTAGVVLPVSPIAQEATVPPHSDLEKEEMEVTPTPLFTAQSYFSAPRLASPAQKDAMSRSFMTSSGSRPVSAILVPGNYGAKGSQRGKPDTHDVLLSLRNEMLGARSVADCLELVDNAMFEIAYEIKPNCGETIFEEEEQGTGEAFSRDIWAPASVCENRAFLAILEFIIEPVEMKYPKAFHRWEATVVPTIDK